MNKSVNSKKIRNSLNIRKTVLNKHLQSNKISVNVFNHYLAEEAVWKGAEEMSKMDYFKNKFITREMYEEYGENIVRRHFYSYNN